MAFAITFGLVAMGGSLLRVVNVYRQLFASGFSPGDPSAANEAARELSRLDHLYTPAFLLVATGVSLLTATVFALWRPKLRVDLPPPLPTERRAETR